ncbi:hypothetical protein [Micromonospora echinofusca]|uniref:DUF11 domain-containing protein n=1 Tax=Micromonospora echinofusca TaxID=47858 RepID=A0ABS3VKS9_MICEH|nr:hypothetical protein [Micromonospora echinofusca]MBO4205117.1 hypothetical protein [Micromonospora echinofusca]
MHDDQEFPQLETAFARFRTGGPLALPAGAGAARTVARRRRTAGTAAAGALTALVIITPVAATAWPEPVPPPPGVDVTTGPPTPSVAPTGAPTASPTGTPTRGATVPGGLTPAAVLGDVTLRIPAWPDRMAKSCRSGPVRFSDGRNEVPGNELVMKIDKVVPVDTDRDGTTETAALITCSGLESYAAKVLVFDRDAGGAIVTQGQVVASTGDVAAIRGIRAADRALDVEVADYAGDGLPDDLAQHQWRSYSWVDGRFRQTGGPTRFPANPRVTDLALGGMDPRLRADGTQRYTGTFTLLVLNKGPQLATAPYVTLRFPSTVTAIPPAGCRGAVTEPGQLFCPMDQIKAGGMAVLEIVLSVDRSAVGSGAIGDLSASVYWGPDHTGRYPEPAGKEGNNLRTWKIIVSG